MSRFNWILVFLSLFLFSCGRIVPREYEEKPVWKQKKTENLSNYPERFSWFNVDLNNDLIPENYVTSIKSQLCGDCYILSAVGLMEIQYQIEHRQSIDLNLSEQYVHECHQDFCFYGGNPEIILDFIKEYGIVREEERNYDFTFQRCFVNCENDISIEKNNELEYYSFEKIFNPLL